MGYPLPITLIVAPKLPCGYGGLSGSLRGSVVIACHVVVDGSGLTTWAPSDHKFTQGVVAACHVVVVGSDRNTWASGDSKFAWGVVVVAAVVKMILSSHDCDFGD